MFNRIMVPIDLAKADKLERAIATAGDLAKHYRADLVLVGATGNEATPVARSPEVYREKLAEFATEAGKALGVPVKSDALVLHDLTVDLNRKLAHHAEEVGADLIVMASHVPGVTEYVFGSHGGEIAQHAKVSVMLVRG